MQEIVLASSNPGKVREINQLLANLDLQVRPQTDYGVTEIKETGMTFVENAIIKARHAARITARAAIADDSGIEVDALDGAPGIYSARYAGIGATDKANIDKLLHELREIPQERRTARFQCLMVYLKHAADPTPVICQGTWEGHILLRPRGNNGFGYDPVFYVPTHACSAAELPPEVKNSLSHRGQALHRLAAAMVHIRV